MPFISLTDDYLIENTWIAERVDELRAIDNVKDFKPLTVIVSSIQRRLSCFGLVCIKRLKLHADPHTCQPVRLRILEIHFL